MLAKNLLPTAGNAATAAVYVEDVFATSLFNGTGSAQTITNDIDLAGKGGMVWWKNRDSSNSTFHNLIDTVRGASNVIFPNDASANVSSTTRFTGFNSNGFGVGYDCSVSGNTHVAWAFRKQAKFFDVVTYTGDGNNSRQVFHALGSAPGMVMVKNTTSSADWRVYHISRSGGDKALVLNSSAAEATFGNGAINDATSTYFRVDNTLNLNNSGQSYVAYIFAHNAGGFGLTGTDNIISCGTFNTNSSTSITVELGYEPQFILFKNLGTEDWQIYDVTRGMSFAAARWLRPNLPNAEATVGGDTLWPTPTGFSLAGLFAASQTIVYMAIRRPMKPPTNVSQVFSQFNTSGSTGTKLTTGFPVDLQITVSRASTTQPRWWMDRVRGISTTSPEGTSRWLTSTSAAVEQNTTGLTSYWDKTGFLIPSTFGTVQQSYWNWRRAPGFFDIAAWTGTGVARSQPHNLGVVPELVIIKRRDSGGAWFIATQFGATKYTLFEDFANSSALGGIVQAGDYSSTSGPNFNIGLGPNPPNASSIVLDASTATNGGGAKYIAYLFATVPGISKIGTYTHTGSADLTVNCGFTEYANFVLIKKIDGTGNWFLFDTARGYFATSDLVTILGNTSSDTANSADYIAPASGGFIAKSGTSVGNAATYLFMAFA
mgnify:CR=1 FL=1